MSRASPQGPCKSRAHPGIGQARAVRAARGPGDPRRALRAGGAAPKLRRVSPFRPSPTALDRAYAACAARAAAHAENFPTASLLLPAPARRHVAAFYAFAREADDWADEPNRGTPGERRAALHAMRARLASLWNVQPGVEHPEELYVTVRIRLNPDRRLAAPPLVVSSGSSARYQAAAEAAVRAVLQGQPYTMLPPDKYQEWKVLDLTFTPKDFGAS